MAYQSTEHFFHRSELQKNNKLGQSIVKKIENKNFKTKGDLILQNKQNVWVKAIAIVNFSELFKCMNPRICILYKSLMNPIYTFYIRPFA